MDDRSKISSSIIPEEINENELENEEMEEIANE